MIGIANNRGTICPGVKFKRVSSRFVIPASVAQWSYHSCGFDARSNFISRSDDCDSAVGAMSIVIDADWYLFSDANCPDTISQQ